MIVDYSAAAINHRIWELVGDEATLAEARIIVYNELLEYGDHTLLWEIFGQFLLRQIETAVASVSQGHDKRRSLGAYKKSGIKPEGWRDKYRNGDADPLDLMWPILGTGTRKALREWTAADAEAHAAYHRKTAKTYRSAADMWSELAKAIGTETIGETKELPATFSKWLKERPLTRIPAAAA